MRQAETPVLTLTKRNFIRRATHGRGLDAAVIAVPSDAVVRQALQLLRGGGQLMLFAHTKRIAESEAQSPKSKVPNRSRSRFSLQPSAFSLDLASVCVDEKDLLGSYSSDFTLQREVARLVFSRQLDVRPLISHRFPLAQTAAAVQLAAHPTPEIPLKSWFVADGDQSDILRLLPNRRGGFPAGSRILQMAGEMRRSASVRERDPQDVCRVKFSLKIIRWHFSSVGRHRPPPLDFGRGFAAPRP